MEPIIKQVINTYGWAPEYAKAVAFEYARFIVLRNGNPKLSPSDDIDKFWHQHMLNTKNYYDYCNKYFARLVHHNPDDADDQKARFLRVRNTRSEYTKKFGPIVNERVWDNMSPTKTAPADLVWKSNNSFDKQKIDFKLVYTFDIWDITNRYIGKAWRANNSPYDRQTITYYYGDNETISDLRKTIADKTGHPWPAVKIYVMSEKEDPTDILTLWSKDTTKKPTRIGGDIKLPVLSKYEVIAVCEEMTMCYC